MEHVLHIKAFSEAEERFMELVKLANVKDIRVTLSVIHSGVLCNDYTISDEAYESIRRCLSEEGA